MRRRLVGAITAGGVLVLATPGAASAHGIGGRADLPVPLSYFIVGAGIALVISFVALAALWPEPRLQEPSEPRPLGGRWIRPLTVGLRWLGVAMLLLVLAAGFFDGKASARNIGPVVVWVYFWLVVPFVVAFAGNLWTWLSPWRTLGRHLGGPERDDLGARLGMWPATFAFMAFVWLELIAPDSADPVTLAWAALVYTIYLVVMMRWLGTDTGLRTGDAFENYHDLLSRISPIGFSQGAWKVTVGESQPDERARQITTQPRTFTTVIAGPHYRGWLRALPQVALRPGLTAFVVAMIGTVSYDGMSGTEWWANLVGDVRREPWFQTMALVDVVLLIGAGYWLASKVAARLAGDPTRTARSIAATFAHTLVPIALAYAFAHYFTLVIFEGQTLIHAASDPFGLGWNLFGTADWRIEFFLSPTAIWYVQVIAIVTGHVAGVILAHDRALAEFPAEVAVRTQYAMLLLMVTLTSLGLFILAG